MPRWGSNFPQTLIVQLARLGDLLQSFPVLSSLSERFPDTSFDLLCPMPLVCVGEMFPGIQHTIPWNGEDWHVLARGSNGDLNQTFPQVLEYFSHFPSSPYSVAYNLNNHPRSVLAAHLFSDRVIGAGDQGPIHRCLPPWVDYLRQVAHERGNNRIHLADALCGLCGVRPPATAPTMPATQIEFSSDLAAIRRDSSLVRIGIVMFIRFVF